MRRKSDWLRETHDMLQAYAVWCMSHLERSALGYPSKCWVDNPGESHRSAGAIVPDIAMPPQVARVDRVIRRGIRQDIELLFKQKYFKGFRLSRYKDQQLLIYMNAKLE